MRTFLRFSFAFGLGLFVFTQAIDFIHSERYTLQDQVAALIMPIGRN